MFEELTSKTVQKVEQGIIVSFPVGLPAMVNGSRVLEYLYRQEVDDYAESRYTEKRPLETSFDPHWFQELKVRFLSRIIAYVITVCSLDGILVQSYRHFVDRLAKCGYGSIVPNDRGSTAVSDRKKEIEEWSFYRNKVFAHTSFAAPQNDSASLQHSSLEYYSGNLLYVKDSYLALGGGSVIVEGQEEDPVPEVSIVDGHSGITEHYAAWEAMFTDILNKIPRAELSQKVEIIHLLEAT